jgi:exodeoxyribonuclease VII small subunit
VANSDKQAETIDFEAAMGELDQLVEKMEHGEFTLEESIKQFERGMQLVRACQQSLRAAEQKVLKLAGTGAEASLQDFEPADDR